jgi:hypothetical protein
MYYLRIRIVDIVAVLLTLPGGDLMARTQYVVVNDAGQWKIAFAGKHYGPYHSQANAIRAAVDAAHRARGDAQVLVQGQNGQFRTEWTYGHDPYPPPG